jgi:Uma2 family endonuclease
MATAIVFEDQLRIPPIASLDDFRRWLRSDDFPQRGRIDYLSGEIEVDMSPENLFFHGTLKTEIATVLAGCVKQLRSGHLFVDATRITCLEASVSAEPDIVFLSDEAIDTDRVRLIPSASGNDDDYIEIEGPPDLIVEIVSKSSEKKDTQRLPAAYFAAGVPEFWLVDARPISGASGARLVFQIHHRGDGRFIPAPADPIGFQRSLVMGKSFRLERNKDAHGRPVYTLHVAE